jgi:hypothetical protein
VIRAAGQRIDLTSTREMNLLHATRQQWQRDAWAYRDMIGELRDAMRVRARGVAKARFYVAEFQAWPEAPIPVDDDTNSTLDRQMCDDAVGNLDRLPLDVDPEGFIARLAENLALVGEGYIHGRVDDDGEELWAVRSVDEVKFSIGAPTMISEFPDAPQDLWHKVDPEAEEVLRCWVRHPRWGGLPDSPLRAVLDVCEDIVLIGRELRAASRSRAAANGILLVPDGVTVLRAATNDDDDETVDTNRFMTQLTAMMLAPIQNEGEAGAVVPAVIKGALDDLAGIRHLRLEREDSERLIEKLQAAIRRLGGGLEVPMEKVTGMGQVNHWGSWQLDYLDTRDYSEPLAATVAGCLTQAVIRPALRVLGHPRDQIRRIGVWYDLSALTEAPDRGQDTKDAHDRLLISDEAGRRGLGFTDDDAPSDEEYRRRIAARTLIDPATAAQVLLQAQRSVITIPSTVVQPDNQRAVPAAQLPAAEPVAAGPGQPPGDPLPRAARPPTVVAAAAPAWQVDVDTARRLTDVDTALREKILTAANAEVERAIERAGGRLRNAVRNHKPLAAQLVGIDAQLVGITLGRDQVAEFGIDQTKILTDTYDRLRDRFTAWVTAAIDEITSLVVRLLRLPAGSPAATQVESALQQRLTARVDAGWQNLHAALDAATADHLYAPPPAHEHGENPGTVLSVSAVRDALAIVSSTHTAPTPPGHPVDGLATGATVTTLLVDQGASPLGFEWRYGITSVHRFEPHHRLDGARFTRWGAAVLSTAGTGGEWVGPTYAPGDHRGCLCDFTTIWATPPADGTSYGELLAPDSPAMANIRQLAELDDAAGRVGTQAQRDRDARDEILALQARHITDYQHGTGRAA